MMTVKRANYRLPEKQDHSSSNDESEKQPLKRESKESVKIITKAAVAKKFVKKKIIPNKKTEFGGKDNGIVNTAKQLQSEIE